MFGETLDLSEPGQAFWISPWLKHHRLVFRSRSVGNGSCFLTGNLTDFQVPFAEIFDGERTQPEPPKFPILVDPSFRFPWLHRSKGITLRSANTHGTATLPPIIEALRGVLVWAISLLKGPGPERQVPAVDWWEGKPGLTS